MKTRKTTHWRHEIVGAVLLCHTIAAQRSNFSLFMSSSKNVNMNVTLNM